MFNYLEQKTKGTMAGNKMQKIGLARDGHFIVGIYNQHGKLWSPCEVDFCNGAIINGEYVYASTMFHPYTVGCYGPATDNKFSGDCTTRA